VLPPPPVGALRFARSGRGAAGSGGSDDGNDLRAHEQMLAAEHEQTPKRSPLSGRPALPPLDTIDLLLASSVSKTIASTSTYPHEVLRVRLQGDPHRFNGLVDCVRKTVR
jgi:hypothetical protein